MEVNQTKLDYKELRTSINDIKRELRRLKKEFTDLQQESSEIENRYQKEVRDAKLKDRDKFNSNITKVHEDKLHMLEQELDKLQNDFSTEMSKYDDSHVSDMYTDEKEMLEEVNRSVNLLNEKIENILGKRFQRELSSQLDSKEIDLTDTDLDDIIQYFNRESSSIDSMTINTKFNILDSISDLLNKLGNGFDTTNTHMFAAYVLFSVLVLFFAAKWIFPIYVVVLFVIGAYNIYRSYKLYSAITSCKIVKDNLNRIDKKLKDEALESLAAAREETQKKYDITSQRIKKDMENCQQEINKALLSADQLYFFDGSDIKNNYETLRKNVEIKRNRNLQKQQELESDLQNKVQKLNELNSKIGDMNKEIIQNYINPEKVGTSYILNDNILVDIDEQGRPVTQELPHESCLFLYDDIDEAINLIKLITYQMRIHVIPQNMSISLFDPVYLGKDFLIFTDKKFPQIFNIITGVPNLKDKCKVLNEEIIKRTRNIKREFNNIDEYNKFMLSQDSLTEPYEFLYLLEPELKLIENVEFAQLLVNGGSLGLFTYIFLDINRFSSGGDTSKAIVDNISSIRIIQNGVIYSKARDYVKEKLIKA